MLILSLPCFRQNSNRNSNIKYDTVSDKILTENTNIKTDNVSDTILTETLILSLAVFQIKL